MTDFDNPDLNQNRSRVWLVSAAISAALVLAYAAAWFFMAVTAREQVDAWAEKQRQRGYTVRYDGLETTGFPFDIRLDIINPGFGAPQVVRPWGWEGSQLSLHMRPWNLSRIRAMVSGPQVLALPFAGKTEMFAGSLGGLEARVVLDGGQPRRVDLALNALDLQGESPGTGAFKIAGADVGVEDLVPSNADHRTPRATLSGRVEGAELPWLSASPLGRVVEELQLESRLLGSLQRGEWIPELEDWRDSGGTVEVQKVDLRHGSLHIRADGTLALDGDLQPIGAMTARVEGFFETVEALQKLDVVSARDAITAKMVLGVLARKPDDGGAPILNLALTLQDRRMYAGPVALLQVPEIVWR